MEQAQGRCSGPGWRGGRGLEERGETRDHGEWSVLDLAAALALTGSQMLGTHRMHMLVRERACAYEYVISVCVCACHKAGTDP